MPCISRSPYAENVRTRTMGHRSFAGSIALRLNESPKVFSGTRTTDAKLK